MDTGNQLPIILASTSPRRLYLMSQVHLNVEVQAPQVDEKPKPKEKPQALVSRLALEKAMSVRELAIQRYESCLVIAADTIVVSPNGKKILGKPNDVNDARKMLKMLSGKTHLVLTGYSVLYTTRRASPKKVSRVVRSRVKIRPLSSGMIDRYVASGEPMDKAGSYAAQGMGMALIERIDGSYTNVVGLPMSQLLMDIEKLCKIPLFSWTKS
jgi:septum formation protein